MIPSRTSTLLLAMILLPAVCDPVAAPTQGARPDPPSKEGS